MMPKKISVKEAFYYFDDATQKHVDVKPGKYDMTCADERITLRALDPSRNMATDSHYAIPKDTYDEAVKSKKIEE